MAGSASSSYGLRQAAAGTPAACRARMASRCVRSRVQAVMRASISSWRARRPSGVARPPSRAQSGSPMVSASARHSSPSRASTATQLSSPAQR